MLFGERDLSENSVQNQQQLGNEEDKVTRETASEGGRGFVQK